MDIDDKELCNRGRQLALKWDDFARKQGYDLLEMVVAADAIIGAAKRFAVLKAVFGDDLEKVIDAMMASEVGKVIKEAQEAIDGD